MTNNGVSCCEALSEALVERALIFIDKFREWGVPIPDGGSAFLEIKFCPFCGVVLPASLRHAWFDKADELGVGPPYERMPDEYQSAVWWLGGPHHTAGK
ncbi:MAG: hypothetical protein KA258_07000 [Deltaproteobacteria bacterium]|nr:hypothetical protein [Deltaproteobacteria bacterium]